MKKLKTSLQLILLLIAFMWVCFWISYFLPIKEYGIVPRTLYGLIGIISAPFLHGSLSHIGGNTITLFGLGLVFSMLGETKIVLKITLMIILGGLLTWILASKANHIGASGLIFAIWAYVLLSADEVRQLAARTSDSTKEIQGILNGIVSIIESSVDSMKNNSQQASLSVKS